MRWLKRNPLNGIAIGILLFLVLIPWILIQVEKPQPVHALTGGTVQGTPTVHTTAVVQDQLKQQDEKLQRDNSFSWILLNIIGSSLGTIFVAVAALIAAWSEQSMVDEDAQWKLPIHINVCTLPGLDSSIAV